MRTRPRKPASPPRRDSKVAGGGRILGMTHAAVIKHLQVAEKICRDVQGRWDYGLMKQWEGGYRCRFPCPECGEEARESMRTVVTGRGIKNEKWMLRWSSKCGHVTGKEELVACQQVPVEEKGVTVGMIEPVSPPEWPRYECTRSGRINYKLPYASFGTLWQAKHAGLQESRILAQVQKTMGTNTADLWVATSSRKKPR